MGVKALPEVTEATLPAQLADLDGLSAPALRVRWAEVLGRPAPRRISRAWLIRVISWHLRAKVYGGIPPEVIKRLQQLAGPTTLRQATQQRIQALTPGTRLLRDWQGETHTVEILTDGFAWRGKKYASLSVIARAITGTQWSGPKFFGLQDRQTT